MKKRVLIVDDNVDNIYMLESLLKAEDMEVDTAQNGKDALKKALADPPDMIVSDILMPVMDGYALCRRCKSDERLKHVPFMFYTATYTGEKDERFARDLGADRFVVKPQDPDVLIVMIKELLEEGQTVERSPFKPFGEEMEFFRRYNEVLFGKLEHKMLALEKANRELQKKEEDTRRNEQFLDSIIENIPDMVFVKEVDDLRFIKVNKAAARFLGMDKRDMIGKNDHDLFLKSQADSFAAKDREVLKNGQLVDIPEESIQTKRLGERIAHTKKIPIFEGKGGPAYLLSIAEDITERKKTEMALKNAFAFQQQLIDSFPLPVFYKDAELRYLGCNRAFEEFFGMKWEDIIGKTVYDIYPKHIADIYQKEDLELLRDLGTQAYKHVVEDRAGSLREVIFHKAVFRAVDGSTGGIIGVIIDIGSIKKTGEETKAAAERSEKR